MDTLALVIVASVIALAVGIPVGIWAARNARVSAAVRPVLDFMQTMPAFVYLIPAVVLFRVGVVPGLVATIIFARSEEHTSELQSLMRISYAVFCLKKKNKK